MLRYASALAGALTLTLSGAVLAVPINVAEGKSVTLNGTYGVLTNLCCGWDPTDPVAPAATLVDGAFLPASTIWQNGTVWWDATTPASANNSVEIDLGGIFELIGLIAQADDNDTYRIEYLDGINWVTAWDIPFAPGAGMQTRPNAANNAEMFALGTPIQTSRLRFTATGGDGFYSVSEIQAFASPIPEPATVALLALGLCPVLGRRPRAWH